MDVDEDLAVLAATLEDWVTPRPGWELILRQGTEFDRRNNVEAELELTLEELVLRFEERDGIAKLARLSENGLDVELFHVLTFT
jgi:hypothetical protein